MDIQKDYTVNVKRNTNNRITYLKKCVHCGKKFKAVRINHICCCTACKMANYRRKKKSLEPLAKKV